MGHNMMWPALLVLSMLSAPVMCDWALLPMDTAVLRIQFTNQSTQSIFSVIQLYGQSTECYQCPLDILCSIAVSNCHLSPYANITTQWPYTLQLKFVNITGQEFFKPLPNYHFGEHGAYTMQITDDLSQDPYYTEDLAPISTYRPLIIATAVLVALAIAWPLTLIAYHKWRRPNKRFSNSFENQAEREREHKKKKRIVSLDVFRGMCIVIMIFVNYDGGGYWFFSHSLWNGLTVADLVFPWFIMIMGVAMPLSFQALLKNEVAPRSIMLKVVRRSVIMFCLGLYINNGANILYWRVPGVLQRFAVAYLVTGTVILFVPTIGKRQRISETLEETDTLLNNASSHLQKFKSHFFPFALHWSVAILLVAIWFIVTFFLEVPGCPHGYIGPGGIAQDGRYVNCTGGAAGYIDKKIFGENHIFRTPTCQWMYKTGSYDPEGLLGNLTSIFLCFTGVLLGRILQVHPTPVARVWRWMAWGVFFCSLAALLCKASQNDGWIPINKNLWSASFVFLMGGGGFFVFAACYALVDVLRIWNGAPFVYVGMNSIIVYVGSETLEGYFPFSFYTTQSYAYHSLTLGSNILGTAAWVTIAYIMYRKQFFVNI